METVYSITGVIWPLVAIFALVVSIIANNRYGHASTKLLLAGAIISLGTTIAYPLLSFLFLYTDINNYELVYRFMGLISLAGAVVFVAGLFAVVNYLSSPEVTDEQHLKF